MSRLNGKKAIWRIRSAVREGVDLRGGDCGSRCGAGNPAGEPAFQRVSRLKGRLQPELAAPLASSEYTNSSASAAKSSGLGFLRRRVFQRRSDVNEADQPIDFIEAHGGAELRDRNNWRP